MNLRHYYYDNMRSAIQGDFKMIKDVDLDQLKKDLGHHYSEFLSFVIGITDENIDRIVNDRDLQLNLITEKSVFIATVSSLMQNYTTEQLRDMFTRAQKDQVPVKVSYKLLISDCIDQNIGIDCSHEMLLDKTVKADNDETIRQP